MLDVDSVAQQVRSHLPDEYAPLYLSFRPDDVTALQTIVTIGDDCGTDICVDLKTSVVLSVDPEGRLPTRFVNTTIERFAWCIGAHRGYRESVSKSRGPSEELSAVGAFRLKLREVDHKVLEDAENWWAVIIEQASDGFL